MSNKKIAWEKWDEDILEQEIAEEFHESYQEEDEEYKTPAQIPDGYGDGGERGTPEGESREWWSPEDKGENTLERYDDHPGWLWDASSEEWVPDPDFQG